MATNDKTVKVTITTNHAPYIRGVSEASTATKKFGSDIDKVGAKSKGVESSFSKASTAMKGFALGGAAIAGTALVGFLTDSVKAAGDLEQSIGGVDSVFKDSAQQIHDFGKTSAEAVGLSTNEFNQLITVTGAMLKNKGLADFAQKSLDLVKVGADLAAQFGGSTKDAVDALNAAMRGESDPIERYGISLNETAVNAELAKKGLTGLTGAALDQAKAAARIDIITRQSADAMGAFGREADTLQGQQQRLNAEWENAKAQLGGALLPALTSVTDALRGGLNVVTATASVWAEIPDPIKAAAAALIVYRLAQDKLSLGGAAIAGTVQSLGEALQFAREAAEKAGGGLKGLSAGFNTFTGTAGAGKAAMAGFKNAGSSLMALAGGPWGLAIGGLTLFFTDFIGELQKGEAQVDAIRRAISDLAQVGDVTPEKKLSKFFDIFKDDLPVIRDQLAKAGVSWTEYTQALATGGPALDNVEQRLLDAGNNAGIFGDHLGTTIDITHRWNAEMDGSVQVGKDVANALKGVATTTGDVGAAADKAAPKVNFLAIKENLANDAAEAAVESHKALAQAIIDVSDAAVTADESEANWQQAIDDATKALEENGKTANKAKDALNLNTQAGRDNQAALIDMREAARTNAEALLNQGDSADAVKIKMEKMREAFVTTATKMGLSKTAAEKLATQYGLTADGVDDIKDSLDKIPKDVKTTITVADAAAKTAIAGITALLEALRKSAVIRVTGVSPANRAQGGIVRGPGTTTSDSIPALLSDQEYVVKAAAVQKYGVDFFDRLNAMRFAQGGFVTRMPAPVSGSGAGIDYDRLGASLARHMPPMVSVQSGLDAANAAKAAVRDWEWRNGGR